MPYPPSAKAFGSRTVPLETVLLEDEEYMGTAVPICPHCGADQIMETALLEGDDAGGGVVAWEECARLFRRMRVGRWWSTWRDDDHRHSLGAKGFRDVRRPGPRGRSKAFGAYRH